MGIANRDYQRGQHRPSGSFLPPLTPVVKALLIANVAIYLLDLLLERQYGAKFLRGFGAFTIRTALQEFRLWEFLTFQFLHGSIAHVLFNCIGLYFFGPWLERWWGSARFLAYYLLCGAAGAGFFTLLVATRILPDGVDTGLVGASAGIYGILIGVAVIAPNLRVSLLFPPIELSMRQMAIALLVIAAGSIVFRLGGNEGGEAGHLGGAILGFAIMRFPWLLGRGAPPRFVHRPLPPPPVRESKLRPRSEISSSATDDRVNAILDKISRDGIHSITEAEREFLRQSSNRNTPPP